MDEHLYKLIEIIGTSKISIQDAIENAIAKAGKSVHGMSWFEVQDVRGHLVDNKVDQWQVILKVGFVIDDK